jgi:HK97 gp10 family phage protein
MVKKVERQSIREAVTKAARPMRQAVKALAPKQSGLLRRSISIKIRTYKRSHMVMAVIGPNRETKGIYNGEERRPIKYAHLVEFGTADIAGRPYFRPAFDSTKKESLRIYKIEVGRSIHRIAARVGKKMKL